jgi:hypothetical protein
MGEALSEQEIEDHLRSLQGLEIALAWKGYGSAIFLELGRLSPPQSPRGRHARGEACVMVEWDWRVEKESSVLFGSSDTGPSIETGIRRLQGCRIAYMSLGGSVP